MKIDRIKATNIELTDAIRAAVEAEVMSLAPLAGRFDGAATAQVEVGKPSNHHHTGDVFHAEINLTIPGKLLRAEAEGPDLYVVIKDATKRMHTELAKEKDKHDTAKHQGDTE